MEYLNIYTEPQTNANEKWYIEAEYLKMIFIDKNFEETIGWYNTMLNALPPDDYLADLATRYYEGCLEKVKSDENAHELLALLTEAIRIAPSDCPTLIDSHMLRAEILIKSENYERAIIDLKVCKAMLGPKFCTNLQLLVNLTRCFILSNNKSDAENMIELLRSYRKKYSSIKRGKNDKILGSNTNIDKLWKTIRELEKQLRQLTEMKNQINGNVNDRGPTYRPYMGYTSLYPKIKNASVACSLIKGKKVHANRTIPMGELILSENPYVCELVNAKVQCSVCQDNVINLISCSECHMISYCSLECKSCDQIYHRYECNGYKMMLLPLLDAKLVLRLLLRGLMYMTRTIFTLTHVQLNNATDLFNVLLMEAHKDTSSDYFNILIMDAKYEELTPQDFDYCTMMSLRLSIYLTNFTTVIDDFFSSIQSVLCEKEIKIFIGALIMRHTAHVKLKKMKLTFNVTSKAESPIPVKCHAGCDEESDVPNRALTDDDCVLYALRVHQLQFKVHNFLKRTKMKRRSSKVFDAATSSVVTNFDKYYYNIVRSIFEKAIMTNSMERNSNSVFSYYVDEMYKEFFFYHNYNKCIELPQTLRCIYPTLSLFEHSCDPNCFVIVLQPGTILVKSIRTIEPGERLSISYGVNYKQHSKQYRKEYLQNRLIICKCKYCEQDDLTNLRKNEKFPIECRMCHGTVPYDTLNSCHFCRDRIQQNTAAKELLYRIDIIKQKIIDGAKDYSSNAIIQAEFTILISLIEIWGKNHIDVYRQKLKLATFLANQNLVVQAYIFFKDIPIQSKNFYPNMSMQLYNEYRASLTPLFEMLQFNIKHNKSLVSKQPNLFSEIYEIIFYIASQMQNLNEVMEYQNDQELNTIYKKILGYKDSFNPGVLSPNSVGSGSDTSLDGVRFFNGSSENDSNTNGFLIEAAFCGQNDAKAEKTRGSSDLNACMIIAETYNSGYKHLDLFAPCWSDEENSSDEDAKDVELENNNDTRITAMDKEKTSNLNGNAISLPKIERPSSTKYNRHVSHHDGILVELNGLKEDVVRFRDDVTNNSIVKIPLKL